MTRTHLRLARLARGSGLLTAAVAASALLGWALDVDLLKSVFPGHPTMKPNTAIGLLLSGLALVAYVGAPWLPGRSPPVLCLVVLVLGFTTLMQYVAGFDLGIDTLLFDDPDAVAAGAPAGRMSQISAVSFTLLGAIGVLERVPRFIPLAQAASLAVLGIALMALSAYGWASGMGAREAPFSPVSIHTALLFVLLSAGWLVAPPLTGIMRVVGSDSLGGEVARRLLLPALLVPGTLAYLAQMALQHEWMTDGAVITSLAVASGVAVGAMIWWAASLLDRVESQRVLSRELADSANTDTLTGLGNRRAFDAALAKLLATQKVDGRPFSLLMIDLDHFKSYNDSFGHPAGDEALRQSGMLLSLALRPGDIPCRYGGEEFAVLLPAAAGGGALRVAERIVEELRGGLWLHRRVTCSIGVTESRPGDDAGSVVARADAALYAAKAAGRDRALRQD